MDGALSNKPRATAVPAPPPAKVKAAKCPVCGSAASTLPSTNDAEGLCWICRRLKISAWRDADSSLGAPE